MLQLRLTPPNSLTDAVIQHLRSDPAVTALAVVPGAALKPSGDLRAIAVERCGSPTGNVGQAVIHQILDILAMITGMP